MAAKRKKDSKVHAVVAPLWHLLALLLAPVTGQDPAQVKELAGTMQERTGKHVRLPYVDRGYSGTELAAEAETESIRLEVVKHPGAQLRLSGTLSTLGEGLRAVARYCGWPALRRFRLPLSPPSDCHTRVEPTTRSS
jgi:hypothetical protein